MYGVALITGSLRTAWHLWVVVELGRCLLKVCTLQMLAFPSCPFLFSTFEMKRKDCLGDRKSVV